jgi:hypothetical protein
MAARRTIVVACGVVNCVIGGIGSCLAGLATMFALTFSGGWCREYLFLICLPLSVACWGLSGLHMLNGSSGAPRSVLVLLGLAVCFGLVYQFGLMLPNWIEQLQEGGNDVAVLALLTLLPGLVVLGLVAQITYFCPVIWARTGLRKST